MHESVSGGIHIHTLLLYLQCNYATFLACSEYTFTYALYLIQAKSFLTLVMDNINTGHVIWERIICHEIHLDKKQECQPEIIILLLTDF